MADKILKSITFPGLPDKYIIPETTVDAVPTQGSINAVQSGGVWSALQNIDVSTDTTLSVSGKPADAKVVGDEIGELKNALDDIEPGLSDDAKEALLNCFQHVVWSDEYGRDYYDALESALYQHETKTLVSISALFEQGDSDIYTDQTLNDLREYLTVTAHYDDGTSGVTTDYTLDGTLTAGTCTITVEYRDKTTTFNAVITGLNYITNNELVSNVGFTGFSLVDGTFDYTASKSYSLVILANTVTKVRYNLLNETSDSRGAGNIIFNKSSDTVFYGTDGYGVYKFTRSGSKYNAEAVASGFATVTAENLNTFVHGTRIETKIENGTVTVQNSDGGKITITNANMIGWWADSFQDWHIRWANTGVAV